MYLRSSIAGIGGVVVLLLITQGLSLLDESPSATAMVLGIDSALTRLSEGHSPTLPAEPTYADELFENYDVDLDGILTSAELPVHEYARLRSCDIDRSGSFNFVEVEHVPAPEPRELAFAPQTNEVYDPNATLYCQLDMDRDGALAEGETPEILWASIRQADTNRDGKVTSKELAAMGPAPHKRP